MKHHILLFLAYLHSVVSRSQYLPVNFDRGRFNRQNLPPIPFANSLDLPPPNNQPIAAQNLSPVPFRNSVLPPIPFQTPEATLPNLPRLQTRSTTPVPASLPPLPGYRPPTTTRAPVVFAAPLIPQPSLGLKSDTYGYLLYQSAINRLPPSTIAPLTQAPIDDLIPIYDYGINTFGGQFPPLPTLPTLPPIPSTPRSAPLPPIPKTPVPISLPPIPVTPQPSTLPPILQTPRSASLPPIPKTPSPGPLPRIPITPNSGVLPRLPETFGTNPRINSPSSAVLPPFQQIPNLGVLPAIPRNLNVRSTLLRMLKAEMLPRFLPKFPPILSDSPFLTDLRQ